MIPFAVTPIGFLSRRARRQEVWLFTQRLGRLIANGVPEAEAVRVIVTNMPEGRSSRMLKRMLTNLGLTTPANLFWRFSRVLNKVLARLEHGCLFSEALSRFPKYFPSVYLGIVAAGERSGDLPGALELAGESVRGRDVRLDRVLLGIMIPVVAVGFAYLRLQWLGRYVWPQLAHTAWEVEDLGFAAHRAPVISEMVGKALQVCSYGIVFVLVLFGALFFYPAMKSLTLHRFCLLMKAMLRARVPLEECRKYAIDLSFWFTYRRAVAKLFRRIEEGQDFASALASSRYFPAELKWIVTTGQYRNDIVGSFSSAAEVLSNKSDTRYARLMDVAPPLLTILIAIPVGTLAYAMFSIFQWMLNPLLP